MGTAVHLPRQQLQLGDVPFRLAIAPRRRQRRAHRRLVLADAARKGLHRTEPARLRLQRGVARAGAAAATLVAATTEAAARAGCRPRRPSRPPGRRAGTGQAWSARAAGAVSGASAGPAGHAPDSRARGVRARVARRSRTPRRGARGARVSTATRGRRRSHAANVCVERSGSRSTTCLASRSTRIVP